VNRPSGLPLAASIAGHCCILLALILFLGRLPLNPLPVPEQRPGIEVMLTPAEPVAAPQPAPQPPPIPEPPPPPPVVETAPPPTPHPAPRVVVRPPPRRPPPRPEREVVQPLYQPPTPYVPLSPAPQQAVAIPRPVEPPRRPAAPTISGNYRAELSAWLAGHKRYPESARERGEEGQAVLRFRVDRSGRVLSYTVVGSSGYPDLDAAVDAMMRGAVLPPFPPDMTANDIEVSVAVRFSLVR
jgi:protein TonB